MDEEFARKGIANAVYARDRAVEKRAIMDVVLEVEDNHNHQGGSSGSQKILAAKRVLPRSRHWLYGSRRARSRTSSSLSAFLWDVDPRDYSKSRTEQEELSSSPPLPKLYYINLDRSTLRRKRMQLLLGTSSCLGSALTCPTRISGLDHYDSKRWMQLTTGAGGTPDEQGTGVQNSIKSKIKIKLPIGHEASANQSFVDLVVRPAVVSDKKSAVAATASEQTNVVTEKDEKKVKNANKELAKKAKDILALAAEMTDDNDQRNDITAVIVEDDISTTWIDIGWGSVSLDDLRSAISLHDPAWTTLRLGTAETCAPGTSTSTSTEKDNITGSEANEKMPGALFTPEQLQEGFPFLSSTATSLVEEENHNSAATSVDAAVMEQQELYDYNEHSALNFDEETKVKDKDSARSQCRGTAAYMISRKGMLAILRRHVIAVDEETNVPRLTLGQEFKSKEMMLFAGNDGEKQQGRGHKIKKGDTKAIRERQSATPRTNQHSWRLRNVYLYEALKHPWPVIENFEALRSVKVLSTARELRKLDTIVNTYRARERALNEFLLGG
ncbi:unnamed protein product [Amoebophrya sp. A25]|nr:unnamed protein product [Amoebophrya sp. A25]|eukprot:GSA25T00001252001.1